MKTQGLLILLMLLWTPPLFAEELTLSGEGVIQYKYPKNFQESQRYIRHGIKDANGDCEFSGTMQLEAGRRIFTKEIAYNPNTCQSLIVEGRYTVAPRK